MNLEKERKSTYYNYDISDLSEEDKNVMIKYAKKEIVKDEKELINYAIVKGLENYLINMDKKRGSKRKPNEIILDKIVVDIVRSLKENK